MMLNAYICNHVELPKDPLQVYADVHAIETIYFADKSIKEIGAVFVYQ